MTPNEQLAALRSIAPFDLISDDGLTSLIAALGVRKFAAGATVRSEASTTMRLFVVIAGSVSGPTDVPVGPIIGLSQMFVDTAQPALTADHDMGASVIVIERQNFFTLARASPELVRGFIELAPAGS